MVSDEDGEVVRLQDIGLHFGVLPLAARQLRVSLNIASLDLQKIPAQQRAGGEHDKDQGYNKLADGKVPVIKAFELPDIFFREIVFSALRIASFHINKNVAGQELCLSSVLTGRANIGKDNIDAAFDLVLEQNGELLSADNGDHAVDSAAAAMIPGKVSIAVNFDSSDPVLTLRGLNISADGYNISGKGHIRFAGSPKSKLNEKSAGDEDNKDNIDFKLTAISEDISRIIRGYAGKMQAQAVIKGGFDSLLADVNADLDLKSLREGGLSPVSMNLRLDNILQLPRGELTLRSAYKGESAYLRSGLGFDDERRLLLNKIEIKAPGVAGGGNLLVDSGKKGALIKGRVRADISSLQEYSDLLGNDVSGALSLDLRLGEDIQKGADAAGQDISFNLRMKDILYKSASFSFVDIKGVTQPQDDVFSLNVKGKANYRHDFSFSASADILGLLGNNADRALSVENISADINSAGGIGNNSGGNIHISGQVLGGGAPDSLAIKAEAKSFPLSHIPAYVPPELSSLAMNANVDLSGSLAAPRMKGRVDIYPLSFDGKDRAGADLDLLIKTSYENGRADLKLEGRGGGIRALRGDFSLPLSLSLLPYKNNLSGETALSGGFKADFDAGKLGEYILTPGFSVKGGVKIDAKLGGAVERPQISARISVKDGSFKEKTYGVQLVDIAALARVEDQAFIVENLSGSDGESGTLKISGRYDYFRQSSLADFKVTAKELHLLKGKIIDGRLGADLTFRGKSGEYALSGDIKPDYISINIPSNYGVSIPQVNIIEKDNAKDGGVSNVKRKAEDIKVALDLLLDAKQRVFVRGWGLDCEFGGKVKVSGSLSNPLLDGAMNLKRGTYQEFGKRFEIKRANLRFSGTVPPSPFLDILAQTDAGDIKAQISLSGSVSAPKIKMSSIPALPEDEVLAKVLFGKDISKISPYQAIELAQTMRRFASGGGGGAVFDPVGNVMQATGVDDLNVEMDEEGGASVGAGKYLSDNVYLEVKGGSAKNSAQARIEIEVTPNITVESEIGQDAQGGAGVFWKKDY